MSVKRREDGRWRVDVVVKVGGVRQRERTAAKTREEGKAKEAEIRARLSAGHVAVVKVPTFVSWASEFVESSMANNKPSTRAAKEQIIRDHLLPAFGPLRLDAIGVERIEKLKAAALRDGVAPKTINNRLTVLRRMLSVAHAWGRLRSVPPVQWLALPPKRVDFLTFEEAARLVEAAGEWRTMVLVALRTGLRRGELLALRWEDVDLTGQRITVRRSLWGATEGSPKGGRTREVPLSPEALSALRALPTRFAKGYVFASAAGERLTPGLLKWPLWNACKAAGLRKRGWHVLRHTFASHLVMRGVPIRAVQDLLGHVDIKQTLIYAHLAPAVFEDAVSRLDGRDPIRSRSQARSST